MSGAMTYTEILRQAFQGRRWERNPRRGTLQPSLLHHRFPIKGGLTFGEALMRNNSNPFLEHMMARKTR